MHVYRGHGSRSVNDELALSWAETERRFNERQEFLERTAEGSAFYKACIPRLAIFIRQELEEPDKTHIPRGLSPVLKRLKDPELIAISALTALMQSPNNDGNCCGRLAACGARVTTRADAAHRRAYGRPPPRRSGRAGIGGSNGARSHHLRHEMMVMRSTATDGRSAPKCLENWPDQPPGCRRGASNGGSSRTARPSCGKAGKGLAVRPEKEEYLRKVRSSSGGIPI